MLSNLKQTLSRNLINLPGWRTNRKIVVIESDDWGSIRMPSKKVYEKLLKAGIRVDRCPYNKYDSLASEEDLEVLFETLKKHRDKNGNPPIITANTIVANPDFEKIRKSGYKEYYYEPFTETLKKYPEHQGSFDLWKQGMKEKIFWPQFHGREHLNVNRWLKFLQNGSEETRLAFDHEMFGISTTITKEKRKSYLAALDFEDPEELDWQKEMLADGLDLFERIFGFKSESYIATNYTWHPDIEPVLAKKGVRFFQGAGAQRIPNTGKPIIHRHFLGEKNNLGQTYLTRNCAFEPSLDESKNWISSCLREISIAFLWKKPAVISSHRLNFIGSIDENNRKRNLKYLETLLKNIFKKWPEVEFMTSDQLGTTISMQK